MAFRIFISSKLILHLFLHYIVLIKSHPQLKKSLRVNIRATQIHFYVD